MSIALSTSDSEVLDALDAELEDIKITTGEPTEVSYAPEAWTREGRTD